jgi:hypothetical protein
MRKKIDYKKNQVQLQKKKTHQTHKSGQLGLP